MKVKKKNVRAFRGVIAIDGPAGAGKSTAARGLARALGLRYVDTGAMYRAAAWRAVREKIDLKDAAALARSTRRLRLDFTEDADGRPRLAVDGVDATDAIRTPETAAAASVVAALPAVRKELVRRQKALGRAGAVVMEGRDIGTVVFPDADIKFFIDASPEERARRRCAELRAVGRKVNLRDIADGIRQRDLKDRTRAVSPLTAAADAVVVDTTGLEARETLARLVAWVERLRR
jgi:cytidylate kinase